ncbi:hypothetical protein HOA69_01865 [Candidatus Woesearchaeota archaeon]|nr:hypothetical protein [Candidatus Woesearchaeota archaeon]
MNKKGDWDNSNGSMIYLILGFIFLYVSLMPFIKIFPFNFAIEESLLRIMVAIVGVIILIESFKMDPINKAMKIASGFIFAVVGLYLFFSYQNATWIPFFINPGDMVLQIILIIYATYLFFGAFRQ